MAYSMDYIKRAVEYKDNGHTFKQLTEAFNISPVTYYDWKNKLGKGFYDEEKKIVERSRLIDKKKLKQAVEEKPDAYLSELAEPFGCTPQAVFYALKKMDFTYKKKPLRIPKNREKNARRT